MTSHVIDYNLLIKCLTLLLIVGAVVLIIFKAKWGGLKLKTKYGDVELNKGKEDTKEDTKEEILPRIGYSYYTAEREIKKITNKLTNTIGLDVLDFAIENKLYNKTRKEMNNYIEEKTSLFRSYFDNEFAKSDIFKNITIVKLLGDKEPWVKQIITEYYLRIYDNHCENYEKKIDWLHDNAEKKLNLSIMEEIEEISKELTMYDKKQIEKCLIDITKIIYASFDEYVNNSIEE